MWGDCAGERRGQEAGMWVLLVKAQPGHWLTPQWTCLAFLPWPPWAWVLVPEARGGLSLLRACPREETTGGLWSGLCLHDHP